MSFKRKRVVASLNDEGGAEQQHRDRVNINSIMRKYQRTGSIEHLSGGAPLYGDFSFVVPLHEALQQVAVAREAFMALPAEVRKAADNDEVEFLAMWDDDEGRRLLGEAGLFPVEDLVEDDVPASASTKSDFSPLKPEPADLPVGDPEGEAEGA